MATSSTSSQASPNPSADPSANPFARALKSSLAGRLPTWLRLSDVQGLSQLATQATLGVTGLAEVVHGSVYKTVAASLSPLIPRANRFVDHTPGSTGLKPLGITGLVYGGVKGVTRLAGGTVNTLLAGLAPLSGASPLSVPREAMLSVINGVLGDHLLATANPLALSMSLRQGGEPLLLNKRALSERFPQARGKVLVMVHGLCMNDLQWNGAAPDGHGEQLAREQGYTPVYLHYNTGLHTSVNGGQLAGLLEQLWQAWPQPLEEISLLTHSMGGLVARSACEQGEVLQHRWRKGLKKLVFLGTPHHGAPLEMLGNWVDRLLGGNIVTKPFAAIGQIRSAGITDLRFGNVQAADWQDADRFEASLDVRQPLPLPEGVDCFTVAATTLAEPAGGLASLKTQLSHQLVGDGLVPVPSALGQHADAALDLAFAADHQFMAWQTGHLALLTSPEVSVQLRRWFGA